MAMSLTEEEVATMLSGDLNGIILGNITYLGTTLGIFQGMWEKGHVTEQSAVTSETLAQAIGLDARYLLEWLRAAACAKYVQAVYPQQKQADGSATGEVDVDVDVDEDWSVRFFLPPAQAQLLGNTEGPKYMGGMLACASAFRSSLPQLVKCFKKEQQGITYSQQDGEMPRIVEAFTAKIYRCIPQLFTPEHLGDPLYAALEQGTAKVIDVGCGSGSGILAMSHRFPSATYLGIDPTQQSILRAEQRTANVANSRVICGFCKDAPDQGSYDIATCWDVVHDVPHTVDFLKEVYNVIKPGGYFMSYDPPMQPRLQDNDDGSRMAGMYYSISLAVCMASSMSDNGVGHGISMGEKRLIAVTREAGFVNTNRITLDGFGVILLSRKPE